MYRCPLIFALTVCSTTVAQTTVQYEDVKLLASDGAENDRYGIKVSISGDRAIVGARGHDDNGEESGAAYIYHFSGDQWIEETKLIASDGMANDEYGLMVSISGDIAIVGSHGADSNGEDSGAAYIYRLVNGQWTEETKLLASDGEANDHFGLRVNISGDTAIVGAYLDDDNGTDSGSAYIYRYDGMKWIEEAKLLASDGGSVDHYGRSVAIQNGRAIVGARLDDDNGADSGSAYIYSFNGKQWIEEIKLLASDGSDADNFGHSVAISGDRIIVGAREGGTSSTGSAYIFRLVDGTWIEEAVLLAEDGLRLDEFGHSVSISGETVIVGAGGDSDIGPRAGSAYLYRLAGTAWISTKLQASDGASYDTFGLAVAVSGNTAVVGSRAHDGLAMNAGAAYIYSFGKLWAVDDDGEADFTTIQAAIDAASDGDEIIVMPGTYTGIGDQVVDTRGKTVWLRSKDGASTTIIDGEWSRRCVVCNSGETNKTVIEGFTITRGLSAPSTGLDGGAMEIFGASPSIRSCDFVDNGDYSFTSQGGAIYCAKGELILSNCTFAGNFASFAGGAIYVGGGSAMVDGCEFMNNGANTGAAASLVGATIQIINCDFYSNEASDGKGILGVGGAVNLSNANGSFVDCILRDNVAGYGGAISNGNSKMQFQNVYIRDNFAEHVGGGISTWGSPPSISDSNVCANIPEQISGAWNDTGNNWVEIVCLIDCNGDLNNDGVVNVTDLLTIIDQWGQTESPADINEDGIVNVTDLLMVVGDWGSCE